MCSLGGFLDAAAGMDTKPIPVRGSGSPRLPGSFPRVRGKRQVRHQGIIVARLIPACAGKTRRLWAWRPPSPAHPRACGENVLAASSASSTPGSSPRVRGKPPRERAGPPVRGLIPACAGKTRLCSTTCPEPRAHPRACGENARILSRTQWTRGSSPRVRGKPIEQQFLRARVGLIPARAGKTPSTTSPKKARPAHPRACGENIKTTAPPAIEAGSSPRVRGKLPARSVHVPAPGLIPARAGKTPTSPPDRTRSWAHPRACGENDAAAEGAWVPVGSSPRVRGKPVQVIPDIRLVGLIPARAGKTAMRTGAGADTGAHPRACGENRM